MQHTVMHVCAYGRGGGEGEVPSKKKGIMDAKYLFWLIAWSCEDYDPPPPPAPARATA